MKIVISFEKIVIKQKNEHNFLLKLTIVSLSIHQINTKIYSFVKK